jgi:hypothetical protein
VAERSFRRILYSKIQSRGREKRGDLEEVLAPDVRGKQPCSPTVFDFCSAYVMSNSASGLIYADLERPACHAFKTEASLGTLSSSARSILATLRFIVLLLEPRLQ